MKNATDEELGACTPAPVRPECFNHQCNLPYGLTAKHVRRAMEDFIDFLSLMNSQFCTRGMPRLELLLMPATFSGMIGEFIAARIPEYCTALVKNRYHNGHPDLIPLSKFPEGAVQYAQEGIEVKASRYTSGWQGHNPESVWLMVFCFDSNTPNEGNKKSYKPRPFRFTGVYAAKLEKSDWSFSGRSESSRRTITASVTKSSAKKMKNNWVYKDLGKPKR
ncbi:MAG: hypothetical protein NZ699_19515 [Roseiflexus sp.]|nr:hypothetical protein [Roseiflexus sp.]MCS7291310.1 hypothetical protein [Roseiflexus sp.]MDW8146645.1 hypothetical protein [Roseiflexaceae bacterium]